MPPRASAARASSGTAETGVATKVTSASTSVPTSSSAPSSRARWARAPSRSWPVTCQPCLRGARPSAPPIRPVPTIAALLALLGEVIAEPLGPLEVHVVQLVAGLGGVDVHHHPDAHRGGGGDVELTRADERHVAEPDAARGRGRKDGVDVVGGREQD